MKHELSERLRTVAGLCKPTGCITDIGCDHGFVSIFLIESGIAERVIASDVNEGPLARAKEHVAAAGLTERITLRLSDGLAKYAPGETDAMLAAGMGGPLMQSILAKGKDCVCKMQYLVLQPQSDIPEFRIFLHENGFTIEEEDMVFEDGKFYPMMRVLPPKADLSGSKFRLFIGDDVRPASAAECFGPILLKKKHPVLKEFLLARIVRLSGIRDGLGESNEERRMEIDDEIAMMKRVLDTY